MMEDRPELGPARVPVAVPPSAPPPAAPSAPWLQPGLVVHDPAFAVDELLADFARTVARRGFSVRGFVRRNHRSGEGCAARIELMDLSDGRVIVLDRQLGVGDPGVERAVATLRRALEEPTDLVVIGRFASLERASGALRDAVLGGMTAGFPVLASVAGKCMNKWADFAGRAGALLTPDPASLWRWWGPDRLYHDLVHAVEDQEIRRIVIGPRWLFVEGERGAGISHLPKGGEEVQRRLAAYRALGLRGLASLIHSWDPVERALAVAAVNASVNHRGLAVAGGDGLDTLLAEDRAEGTRTVLVGVFPGYRERMPDAQVMETNPQPGEFPIAAADCLLPGCGTAILSAACLVNRTLPRMLTLASSARVALAGPATPLTPRLHAYGIDALAGFVVTDADGLAQAVARGAKAWAFASFGRIVHRRRDPGGGAI